MDEQAKRIAELEQENDKLRGIIANAPIPCIYCKLPKDDMAKCRSGFPGCARADDMMCDPSFGNDMPDNL